MNGTIDTTKLDPAELARHLGNPEGEVGKAVVASINKTNAASYSAALQKLGVEPGDRIIEIGFGNGREIPNVLSLSTDLTYFGLDISDTMVADAAEFNAEAVREGRVTVAKGTSTTIPADANAFDKALTLNTIYFWSNPADDLKKLRRVLRPDGCLVVGSHLGAPLVAPFSSTVFASMNNPKSVNCLRQLALRMSLSTPSARPSFHRPGNPGMSTISLFEPPD